MKGAVKRTLKECERLLLMFPKHTAGRVVLKQKDKIVYASVQEIRQEYAQDALVADADVDRATRTNVEYKSKTGST